MNRLILTIAATIACLTSAGETLHSQEKPNNKSPQDFHRQIFVPLENLDVLLDGNSNRVLLSRDEYDALLKSAKTREIKRAPMDSAILSANYTGEISEGVALIKGELVVEALNEGLVQIPLPLTGVAIRSAAIDGQPAKLWRNKNRQIVLVTDSQSRQTLKIEMTVPLQTSAARQSMSLQLPAPSATSFQLNVPGNVEVKSGVPVVERTYDQANNTTQFDLLPSREPMSIVMSLNNRLLKDEQVTVSRSVLIHKLMPHSQEMHVTCSMDVIHGVLEQVEFSVPDGFQVSHVFTELLSQWEMTDAPQDANESGKRLLVKLRQPTREDFVLNITAVRNTGAIGQWKADDIRPVDVAGHVSVVGVLADTALKSAKLVSEGVIPIDHEFLLAAIPESVKTISRANPAAVVAAFYAPQKDYSIASSFSSPDPELIVKSNARLVIDDQMLELQGGISMVSLHDSRFDFKIILPKSWRLNELTGADGNPIRFDRISGEGDSEFLVHLPTRISSTTATKVFFRATKTPEGWLEKWESNQVEFPTVEIEGESKHTGAIAISTDEDLTIKPGKIEKLELLDDTDKPKFELNGNNAPLAYRFERSDYQLSLKLDRLKPSVTARTYNYARIKPTQMLMHAELVYDIKQARASEFKFELPLESPKSISIKSAKGSLKDYHSQETKTGRQWTVQLSKPVKGKVHLLVDYQMPLKESELAEIKLAPVSVTGVDFQSSMFAIEGCSELDIEIETKGRSVDVGEFSEAVYQPGRYLLGAFSWPNEKLAITVKSTRRPVYQLPSAIVQRAEMVTSISNNGKSQTAARFKLVTKQQPFLRVELPADATLWSVQLDGQPAKPQLQDGALLISLIGNETGKLRDLQLVFESPARSFNFVGKIQAHPPSLWLNETGTAQGIPVPLVDMHWRLIMPDGFSVSHNDGKFQSDQLVAQPTPIQQLGNWIYRLGGGIGWHGVTGKNAGVVYCSEPVVERELFEILRGPALPRKPVDSLSLLLDESNSLTERIEEDALKNNDIQNESGFITENRPLRESKKSLKRKKFSLWALSGLRSLDIQLTDTGNAVEFYNLGEQPVLTATLVHQSRMNWVAIALAFLIAAMGVWLTNGKFKSKVIFVVAILLLASLLPLIGTFFDAFRTIIDLAILAAVFVAIYFVVAGLIKLVGRSFTQVAKQIQLLLLLIVFSIGIAGQANAQNVVNDAAELKRLIAELQAEPNVKLPSDAIIIPFDAKDPRGRQKADRLLLPYEHYLKLMNKADADGQPKTDGSPANYILSSAQYDLQLTLDADVSIKGELVIDVLTDDPLSIALPLMGGALANATVDDEPAKLQFKTIENRQQTRKQLASNPNTVLLHLEGRGTKTLKFTVQIKPDRQGGWRITNAKLPVGMTRSLNIKSLPELTEVRLNSSSDRRSIEAKANQAIATVLDADGSLRLQWKPSTATQTVDQTLTAKSEAIFDVREDGLRLTWRTDLDFRGSERDVFTFNLPDGFLVEQVSGENIRSWDVKKVGQSNRLNVSTLSAAKDKETFTIELSQRDFAVGQTANQFDAPYLTVEGAALHKGVYTIRRSPIIELKTNQQRAASRIDEHHGKCKIDVSAIDSKSSPLGIKPFQCLQFVTTPFQIGLQANLVPRTIKADTQAILRIGQSEADLETKINIVVGARPIYKLSFDLPKEAEIRSLTAGLNETWTSETIDDIQRIQFFFPSGVADDFSIILDAGLTAYSGQAEWEVPKIKINDVERQNGFIAVQVDPALSISANGLRNCESVLMQQVEGWLNRSQRSSTRVVLRTKGADYDAKLRFAKIAPRVTVQTVTNVRTTLFAIEETILLDFDIQQAGIRQVQFELPISMQKARINAKLVSETIIDRVADNPDIVRVTLNLQDEVIDSFRVVVENDRELSSDRQNVPVPRVLTGDTQDRFATLQNAGRDEINVLPGKGFQSLNRQLKQFAQLKQKLSGGEVTMAYVAADESKTPVLQYETKQRDVFDTVAASIEFSKTTMVVDSSGAYRALQNFQVNNRSEQYLEIELPEGAQLLTVLVEGEPVKPVAWPAAANQRRLRIPLVKTQLGDLDYPVQLKYAGQLGALANFKEIEFPVIETLNINVQLSQLHLRLPSSHRWMNFGGTMTKVDDQGKLQESYLSYKRRQIQQLTEQIQFPSSSLSSYSQKRAYGNLKKLEQDMQEFEMQNNDFDRDGNEVLKILSANNDAIEKAGESYRNRNTELGDVQFDNRARFNTLVEQQQAKISRNSINKAGQNFNDDVSKLNSALKDLKSQQSTVTGSINGNQEFDGQWLSRNQLGGVQLDDAQQAYEVLVPQPRAVPNAAPGTVQLNDSIGFLNPNDQARKPGENNGEIVQRYQVREAKPEGDRNDFGGNDDTFGKDGVAQRDRKGQNGQLASEVEKESGLGSSLSSLDIELPARGLDFYFKSPRGKATVIARPLESRSFSRWLSVLISIGVCFGAVVACWIFSWISQKTALRRAAVLCVLLIGLISLASSFLPIYGFIALIGSSILLIHGAINSMLRKALPKAAC